ncbi:MAG: hypothetical protein AB7O44_20985 [Hyphomicrobiaceae bacterium]
MLRCKATTFDDATEDTRFGRVGEQTVEDGYNQLPYPTGQQNNSARREFLYFNDDGQFVALRVDNWKTVFCEQRTQGTLGIWREPFVCMRAPTMFNLRMDPMGALKSPPIPTTTICCGVPSWWSGAGHRGQVHGDVQRVPAAAKTIQLQH